MKNFAIDFAPVAFTYAVLIFGMAALIHATPNFWVVLRGAL